MLLVSIFYNNDTSRQRYNDVTVTVPALRFSEGEGVGGSIVPSVDANPP